MPRRLASLAVLCGVVALLAPAALAQQANWGEIAGQITDAATGEPIPGATVLVEGTSYGTSSNDDGRYRLRLPATTYALAYSFVGYETLRDTLTITRQQTLTRDVALVEATAELDEALVEGEQEATDVGVSIISPETIENMPSPLNDPFDVVKTELGVTSNNETSNAYSVRGGGYNENLFFIDGFEIYRPLRTDQGEQEGLGLANGDLVERMTLYAGGFPARYGGKLSSVLDVAYTRPAGAFSGTVYGSTLDAGTAVGGGLLDNRVGVAVAARRSRPASFFAAQELEGIYDPEFRDVQGVLDVRLAEGHSLHGLGILARHRFNLEPSQRETTFGVFPNLLRTVAFRFEGEEFDGYDIRFGGLRLVDRFGRLLAEHSASYYETEEFESYDVTGNITLYRLERDPDRPPDDPFNTIQTGQAQQRDVADNVVDVTTLTGGGRYRLPVGRHLAEVGWQARRLTFDDRLLEFTQLTGRDSLGFAVGVTVDSLADRATLDTYQGAGWAEATLDLLPTPGRLIATLSARADYFEFNDEWTVGPRLGLRYRWDAQTTLSGAVGLYHQAPTYRELRGEPAPGETILGALNRDLESQRTLFVVAGGERFFPGTRFSMRAEAWYKDLDNLISYEIQNVRVLYSGENDAEGYAYGFDLQVRGELVPGLESWLNYGYLKTEERFFAPNEADFDAAEAYEAALMRFERLGAGALVPRPTDRRHNVSLFVQDYVPGDDTWTLHVRTLFGTGLPYTPPAVSENIDGVDVFVPGQRSDGRYPEYFRFDMGATKQVRVGRSFAGPIHLKLTAEVLNVFDMKNTILFDWVDSGRGFFEGVPTRLTPRTVNVRARIDF
ncbi:MAG: TonB-dependent receptor [Rubricoccaceae bacterium]|nr:TonB-dependent receptor [Rubricoccaceae bacterium]